MKRYEETVYSSIIVILDTRWNWVVSYPFVAILTLGSRPSYLLHRRPDMPLPEIESLLLCRPTRSLVARSTELSRLTHRVQVIISTICYIPFLKWPVFQLDTEGALSIFPLWWEDVDGIYLALDTNHWRALTNNKWSKVLLAVKC